MQRFFIYVKSRNLNFYSQAYLYGSAGPVSLQDLIIFLVIYSILIGILNKYDTFIEYIFYF